MRIPLGPPVSYYVVEPGGKMPVKIRVDISEPLLAITGTGKWRSVMHRVLNVVPERPAELSEQLQTLISHANQTI